MLATLALLIAGSDIEALMAPVLPTAEEEKWLSIPWRTDLGQALSDSRASGKPIFLWIMNGDPMGCT